MAVVDEGLTFPESTGAVKTPGPVEVVVPVTADSTGEVTFDNSPTETKFGPSGQKPAGNVETPGPETTVNASIKVINAPSRAKASGQTTAETSGRHADDSSGR